MVKHDFKSDPEIDAIIKEHANGNKSAFFKAAIKAYVQPKEIKHEKPIPTVRITV